MALATKAVEKHGGNVDALYAVISRNIDVTDDDFKNGGAPDTINHSVQNPFSAHIRVNEELVIKWARYYDPFGQLPIGLVARKAITAAFNRKALTYISELLK